ncbi:MAG: helix-turn-helix domain-containing protein [Thermoanaerobaculia bacterium]|nr:helix-turn-helix domain-containing protein [Thermoanaerobaculia bacterium]
MNRTQSQFSSRLYDLFLRRLRRVLRSRMPLCEAAQRLGWTIGQTSDRVRGDSAIKLPHLEDLVSKLGSGLVFASLVDLPAAQGSMPSVLARFRDPDRRTVAWLDGLWDLLATMAAAPPDSFVLSAAIPDVPEPLIAPDRLESALDDPRPLLFPKSHNELDVDSIHRLAMALALWVERAPPQDAVEEALQAAYLLMSWSPHPKLVTKLDTLALRSLATSPNRSQAIPAASPCALRTAALQDPAGLAPIMDLHLELDLRTPRARTLAARETSKLDGDWDTAKLGLLRGQLRKHIRLVFGSLRGASAALGASPGLLSHWLNGRREPSLEQLFQLLGLVGLHPLFLALAMEPPGRRLEPDLEERLHLCVRRPPYGPFSTPRPSHRVTRRISAIRSAPRERDRKLYALLDLCQRQHLPQDRIAVLRALLREVDPQEAPMEALDLGVLEALSTLLLDSGAADDALDLALSVVETSVLTGGRERLCWSLACISDCLARLDFQHSARTAAESALTFLAEVPSGPALEVARRIHYRLSVQFLRIGEPVRARRHFRAAAEAQEGIGEGAVSPWQVRISWIHGLLDATGVDESSIRALRHLKTAEDSAFRQRLGIEFCHIALQRLQLALDLGSHERLREMIVDSRTKALILLDELPTHDDLPERFCSLLFTRGISLSLLSEQIEEVLTAAGKLRPDQPVLCQVKHL